MKLSVKNENYCATVVKIHTLLELEGLDNLLGVPAFGFQALVSKDMQLGQLAVLFTAETKLDQEFCHHNNLFRHSELNVDKEKVGYLNDDCRIRAIKLRGHLSSALLMPISSLNYLGINLEDFKEGDTFTHINDKEVCSKYVIRRTMPNNTPKNKKVKIKEGPRIDTLLMPEHLDSAHYLKNHFMIADDEHIVVTQKLHGTSARFANQICKRKLNRKEKLLKWFGFKIEENEYDFFAASRRVIKDIKSNSKFQHYYSSDIWNDHLVRIQHLIPKNWVLYGEIIGWTDNGKPIQQNYTYDLESGKSEFYVYRISVVNSNGVSVDLSWDQLKEFCNNSGLKYVPEIWSGKKKDFDHEKFMDKKFAKDLGLVQCVPLSDKCPCDEGVIIRREGVKPLLLKAKAPIFILHETKQLDSGEIDMESEQSE